MDIKTILRLIDAEIEKLQRARSILVALSQPETRQVAKPRRASVKRTSKPAKRITKPAKRVPELELQPEPRLTVLPPKQKREYTRQVKPRTVVPSAFTAPLSSRPVFVPKAAAQKPQPTNSPRPPIDLEAAMRKKLLEGAA